MKDNLSLTGAYISFEVLAVLSFFVYINSEHIIFVQPAIFAILPLFITTSIIKLYYSKKSGFLKINYFLYCLLLVFPAALTYYSDSKIWMAMGICISLLISVANAIEAIKILRLKIPNQSSGKR